MEYITLNPKYYLKPDSNKALLMTYDIIRAKEGEQFESAIHPIQAMILCLCNGEEFEKTIKEIVKKLELDEELVRNFISLLFENKREVKIYFDKKYIIFPPETLINSTIPSHNNYIPEDFFYTDFCRELDRHETITDLTLMLNSNCKTNCIYCYADRKTKYESLSLEQIISLIDQAKSIKVKSFDLIGGDVFAYPYWKEVVRKLYESGYDTFLSTKVPLQEEDVKFLVGIGLKDIQISLDTLILSNLCEIVNRPSSYVDEIKNSILLLSKYGIAITIHTIMCSKNATIKDMESIYTFIKDINNVKNWRINYTSYSLYKSLEDFRKYKAKIEDMKVVYSYLRALKDNKMTIMAGGIDMSRISKVNDFNNPKFYEGRGITCTASYCHLFILPDGKVTICEQLYWNENFLVGDLTKQSIMEVWTSQKASRLFYVQRQDISEKSVCKTCDRFEVCRTESCKVCWRSVIACYGSENWDFPDPQCPKAPKPYYPVHITD